MDCLTDYEILNSEVSDNVFSAKHKLSGTLYHLQGIPLSDLSSSEQKVFRKRLKARLNLKHSNLVQFYEPIQHLEVLYLKFEHCKYGSLESFLGNQERRIHEQLLCKILYQTAFALKTIECFMGTLSLKSIFLTEDFNIKLYNFYQEKPKSVKMWQLGAIMYQICTLKEFTPKSSCERDLTQLNHYSEPLKILICGMLKDQSEIKKNINKILCHPTVLIESTAWSKDNCFISERAASIVSSEEYFELVSPDERIRKIEETLKIKEKLLKEQERQLINRERKLLVMEQTVKEKLQQAEQYLNKCRDKSINSGGSSRSTLLKNIDSNKDLNDSNYATYEDVETLPTSMKLHVDKIVKPSNFSRTMSERRIRFKTSPLKDRNFARKYQDKKSSGKPASASRDVSKRQTLCLSEVENIGWTMETKKHAFQMLRLLNNEEKENFEVKHTVL